jgi:methionyl-tRNA formyltransferase
MTSGRHFQPATGHHPRRWLVDEQTCPFADERQIGRHMRIGILTLFPWIASALVRRSQELGHEPVIVITPGNNGAAKVSGWDEHVARPPVVVIEGALAVAPLLLTCAPDAVLTWCFPWKVPPEALAIPSRGCANLHPSLLPKYRGRMPFAWALRNGDTHMGVTWHRMGSRMDGGPILAQKSFPIDDEDYDIHDLGPKVDEHGLALLPSVLASLYEGYRGVEQDHALATWARAFQDDAYVRVDWSNSARAIHNQVRAWACTSARPPTRGPIAELDGRLVRLTRTRLTDPRDGSRKVATGDGSLWLLGMEECQG